MDQQTQQNNSESNSGSETDQQKSDFVSAPDITLPKGGGAIRGIGEKFAANPVTGTGSLTVPVTTSPGRLGFGPQLSLSYDSGAGNGAFGLGWSLSLPSITRKTDKGLPKYQDSDASDEFILSGAEDLVPFLKQNQNGDWETEVVTPRIVDGVTYNIQRYRPRIEGLFARIERWTNQSDPSDSFWRSISKDNITTWYGKTSESRIFDPKHPDHIFSWLICESYDDKGNVIVYGYEKENSNNMDVSQVNEKNRTDKSRSANRYLKRIRYSNHTPYFPKLLETSPWPRPLGTSAPDASTDWLFEVVFDYGEHNVDTPRPNDNGIWDSRHDPFSTYRAGFEIRSYRLCQRVLMFHHFPDEAEVGANCLVRSTDFNYRYEQDPSDQRNPIHTVMTSVTQCGYRKQDDGSYLKKTMPPVEFDYSQVVLGADIKTVKSDSLENLPFGVDGSNYQWVDLDGEGLSGTLTEQGGAWFYKSNESPVTRDFENGVARYEAQLGSVHQVASMPSGGLSGVSNRQFMDLAGDGLIDLVELDRPNAGFYERTHEHGWQTFRAFQHVPNIDWNDPNLKVIDLTGDGHADVLISENELFTWYPSLAEDGFGESERVTIPADEEQGPRVIFADAEQSIFQADLSGDGLTDIMRIRNGEICYWPNLGYGHFGSKVAMDDAPWFDNPDQFNPRRIRLVDIDGSGVTDIIYLGSNKTQFWFNQSGNSWSAEHTLKDFPPVDNIASITAVDLLGNGTACLVWSTPLPDNSQAPMRYIELMAEGKPHLMIATRNNLGAETRVRYAPSTYFYLKDKQAGKPWLTPLPFPVHVVERVETYDHISRNRFVTRSAYHHGFFDGVEREFRGFGMVEQWDTEDYATLSENGEFPTGENINETSHVPPVLTRTWFHTGVYLGRNHVSDFFAGLLDERDVGEYYRELGLSDAEAKELLLADTVLPKGLTNEEEREACRALRGSMLRKEVYALDGTDKAEHPYSVTEQNFTIRSVQPKAENNHAVFFTHARESIGYQYERNPADPRIAHALTLEVDKFGNVLKQATIGYGRRQPDLNLSVVDQAKQSQTLITYTENCVTNAIDTDDTYRTPLPCETGTYELTGYIPTGSAGRFQSSDIVQTAGESLSHIFDSELNYEDKPANGKQRRLIEQLRTLYRPNDFGDSQNDSLVLLPLAILESLALPGETYKLAFTPGLLNQVYQRTLNGQPSENLLPNPTNVLGGQGADQGGYVDLDGNGHWWIPSGKMFYSENPADTPQQEQQQAHQHFFLPSRFLDTFAQASIVLFDDYDLLTIETRDPLDNRVTVGERDTAGNLTIQGNDYRVLQPRLVMDPNRNRIAVAFDTLGMVVGTAVMGKPEENLGDSLAGFEVDLAEVVILGHINHPLDDPHVILQHATTRLVYDLFAYQRTKNLNKPQSAVVYAIVRETHEADLNAGQQTRIQHSFSYSDGFGREIQKKIQAESGSVPVRDSEGNIIVGSSGQPEMTTDAVSPRWVGSGWTVFNNKGKPVRQYEPFFTDTHRFEFDVRIGVSPVLFYDPLQRVIATLHPNHTSEKVVFDPWRQESWDVNDTVLVVDPKIDNEVGDFFRRLPDEDYLPTWHEQRAGGGLGTQEQIAAQKTEIHADTPTVVHFDSLGRTFLTVTHNKFKRSDEPQTNPPTEEFYQTRVIFDIEGNQREVIDALDRIVMRYDYDMLGNRIHQASMEAGERWILNCVAGNTIRTWDSRGHEFHMTYDFLRRPSESFLLKSGLPRQLVERTVYGESRTNSEINNLRGQAIQVFDQAGVMTSDDYNFKGNLLSSQRQLAQEYKTTLNWSAEVRLEAETFTSHTRYDALNRPTELTAPDNSVIRPGYNEANLLESVAANLQGAAKVTPFVTNIDYDAKGQRQRIDYGNGASTSHEYDPLTFRLIHLLTQRDAGDFPSDCPQPPPSGWLGCQMQNLRYTYDAAGNITHIHDDAQQTIYFRNQRIEPSNEYTYDAIYRLIDATGREHLGQGNAPIPHSPEDAQRVGLLHPGDGNAMGRYLEQYVYDAVGNILAMQHRGSNPRHSGWTRDYTYNETSLLEAGNVSNRLSTTTIGGSSEAYAYEGSVGLHGNITAMPHLPLMQWDYSDQLQATARQVVNIGGMPETTWYVYDASGQRVRKVTERQVTDGQTAMRKKERIYLSGFEIYREYGNDGASVTLERETLHIMNDQQRIALVETRTQGDDGSALQLLRYQFTNHLGSAGLELDDQGQMVSYEEYTPYGNTSYQAMHSQTEIPKRYRYTGMERDEENGLNYHSARYYCPWLARWVKPDPIGIADSVNVYEYVSGNPINIVDPSGLGAWDRFMGGVKMVAGGLETAAGVVLVGVGAATSEIGIGIPIAAAGVFVTAHGADVTVSGARTLWNGKPVDSFSSQGLQAAGVSRSNANLIDAGVSIVGTLGAGAVTRIPSVAAATRPATAGEGLVHLTTAESATAIGTSNTLGRGGTVYAGSASLAEASGAGITLRTGLLPSQATNAIRIPATAEGAFRVPAVVGPFTAWQRLSGTVYSAGAGTVNLTTGAFSRTGPAVNQIFIYGLDATLTTGLHVTPAIALTGIDEREEASLSSESVSLDETEPFTTSADASIFSEDISSHNESIETLYSEPLADEALVCSATSSYDYEEQVCY